MSASLATSPPPRVQEDVHEDLLRLLGFLLLAHGHAARAVWVFDVLHLLVPGDEQVTLSLVYALIQSGRASDALALVDSLPRPARDPAAVSLLRGKALAKLGRGIEAARAMRAFSRLRHRVQHGDA